jgi:uncharacterized protein (DUF58 family)
MVPPVLDAARAAELRALIDGVRVAPEVREYIAAITRATRDEAAVSLGASPRASVSLMRAARAAAVLEGRSYATPDDVKDRVPSALRHRITLSPELEVEGRSVDDVSAILLRRCAPATRLAVGMLAVCPPRIRFLAGTSARVAVAVARSCGFCRVVAAETAIGLLLLGAGIDLALLPARAALRVTRALPESVGIGDAVEGTYTVESTWPRGCVVEVADRLSPMVSGGAGTTTVTVPPFSARELGFQLTGESRGRAPLGSVGVRARTGLGLLSARFLFRADDSIMVVPSLSGVRRFRLLAMQHRLETAGVRSLRRRGEGLAFANLREYTVGDDPRRIDWKATARRAQLITREYTIERAQTVITLIDAGRAMTQLAASRGSSSAVRLLTDIAAAGDRVGTCVPTTRSRVRPAAAGPGERCDPRRVRSVAGETREPDYASRPSASLAAHPAQTRPDRVHHRRDRPACVAGADRARLPERAATPGRRRRAAQRRDIRRGTAARRGRRRGALRERRRGGDDSRA